MNHVSLKLLLTVSVASGLVACANTAGTPTYPATGTYPSTSPAYAEYGRVTNVQLVRANEPSGLGGTGIGAGTVIGGVVGGVLGNQVGSGRGQDIATVAGAVGGALVGNAIEQGRTPSNLREVYRVSVQLDNGAMRTFDYATRPDIRIGDRVRVEGNQLYR